MNGINPDTVLAVVEGIGLGEQSDRPLGRVIGRVAAADQAQYG